MTKTPSALTLSSIQICMRIVNSISRKDFSVRYSGCSVPRVILLPGDTSGGAEGTGLVLQD